MQVRILCCVAVGALLSGLPLARSQEWSVISPNGEVKLTVMLAPVDGQGSTPAARKLFYRVENGAEGARAVVLDRSLLGLRLHGQDFVDGLQFVSVQPQKLVEEAYTLLHGKRQKCRNRANQLSLAFRNAAGLPLELDFRAYDDGAAFRYRLPSGLAGTPALQGEFTVVFALENV